jgi:hypothetical protein
MAIVDKWEGKEMIDKGFSIVVACWILFLIGIGVSITYAQEQFGDMTSTYGNMTKFEYVDALYNNMSDSMNQLDLFSDVCSDYVRLQVEEETDKCRVVAEEFNRDMIQLWSRHNITLDKNIIIAANSLDISPDLLPSPTFYCNSYEVYAGLTDEQCERAAERMKGYLVSSW